MRVAETPTGNIKFRVKSRMFLPDLVILMIEVTWGDGPDDYHGMPIYLAGKGWRDATPEDLQSLRIFPKKEAP